MTLFAERARSVDPEFAVTEANAEAIAEICVRLDGLPLAIELAAARSALFTPEQMLDRLKHGLPTLASGQSDLPARQRTLRGAILWSHDLLTPEQQRVFRRLAIFPGGWKVSAALEVAGDQETDPLGIIESLLRQNLIRREGHGPESRFQMLVTIREFALEQLDTSGETGAMRTALAEWALQWTQDNSRQRTEQPSQSRAQAVSEEYANLNAALEYLAESSRVDDLLCIVDRLSPDLYLLGRTREARSWCERALATTGAPPELRAPVLSELGQHAHDLGDERVAILSLTEASTLARELGDARIEATSAFLLGVIAEDSGNHERAEQHLQVALGIFTRLGEARDRAVTEMHLGIQAYARGDTPAAMAVWTRVAAQRKAAGDSIVTAWCTTWRALALLDQGDLRQAQPLLAELLVARHDVAMRHIDDTALALMAVYASQIDENEIGARWIGAVHALQSLTGSHFDSPEYRTYDAAEKRLRMALGEERFAQESDTGAHFDVETAFAQAADIIAVAPPAGHMA